MRYYLSQRGSLLFAHVNSQPFFKSIDGDEAHGQEELNIHLLAFEADFSIVAQSASRVIKFRPLFS